MRLFIIVCFGLILGMGGPVLAQEAKTRDRLIAEPTQKQMNEARYFMGQCSLNDAMNQRHNCKCLSLQFLEKRVEKGDDVKASQILSELRNTCLRDEVDQIEDLGYKDMSDIPQEVIEEAIMVQQNCLSDSLSRLYKDCDCIAGRFIEDRMREPPMVSSDSIVARYQDSCMNLPQIAGHYYTRCMDSAERKVPKQFVPKYFCECYGSEMADGYKNLQSKPVGDTNIVLMGRAHATCQKKLARDKRALR